MDLWISGSGGIGECSGFGEYICIFSICGSGGSEGSGGSDGSLDLWISGSPGVIGGSSGSGKYTRFVLP